ncbi:MAG TPA: chemotaxis protein CheB, partial [Desulfatirhabdiaceae bacterium]|nr:chemotaxis protein CheB [Desulfatirhabdiaceae bacterium]
EALGELLPCLPEKFGLPILIVQHMVPDADDFFSRYLDQTCKVTVKQADEKERILHGIVYLAPPDHHLMVAHDRTLSLSVEEPVNFARPSIDVLFETAAAVYGSHLVGVILTGASADGSRGLKAIKDVGGLTIVQDPRTAEADIMPRSAIRAVDVDAILPLKAIGKMLSRLTN